MIEQALTAGASIRWRKPNVAAPSNDGTIVQSANPANGMTYLGGAQHRLPNNSAVVHTWLDYIPGRTSYTAQTTDVLTGWMSGCLVARGTYAGGMKVFHIGTVQNPLVSTLVKNTFSGQLPANATGFYPHAAWTINERQAFRKATDILGLVTSSGGFYSVCLCHETGGKYSVGGIKKVPALQRATLLTRLA